MLHFEDDVSQAEAVYHFALSDMVDQIELYGFDVVLKDLTDYYHKRMFYQLHESEF